MRSNALISKHWNFGFAGIAGWKPTLHRSAILVLFVPLPMVIYCGRTSGMGLLPIYVGRTTLVLAAPCISHTRFNFTQGPLQDPDLNSEPFFSIALDVRPTGH